MGNIGWVESLITTLEGMLPGAPFYPLFKSLEYTFMKKMMPTKVYHPIKVQSCEPCLRAVQTNVKLQTPSPSKITCGPASILNPEAASLPACASSKIQALSFYLVSLCVELFLYPVAQTVSIRGEQKKRNRKNRNRKIG